ncbi:MAG: hypothetical protein V4487_05590 [Chlamydiota bacterium]
MGLTVLGAVAKFTDGWGPSYFSMKHGIHVREVNQGGNYILAALPQAWQAMWTGSIVGKVASAVSGPLRAVPLALRCLLSPVFSVPVCLLSAAVKEGFYEGTLERPIHEQTKHYALGAETPEPVQGTVTLVVEGIPRHFLVGEDIHWEVERSTEVIENGKKKSYYYRAVNAGEPVRPKAKVKEILINGQMTRVELLWENTEDIQTRIEIVANGRKSYFKRGVEVPLPIAGTVEVREAHYVQRNYFLGPEIPAPAGNSVEIRAPDQVAHYELGKELKDPSPNTRTFNISGKARHFLNVKGMRERELGISGWINMIPRLPFKMPEQLKLRTVKALNFIAERSSHIIRAITIVAGIALAALGNPFLAVGVLTAVAYEYLDHDLKVIPRKVSLFVEQWMPLISLTGIILVGALVSKVIAAVTLLMYIPAVNKRVHHKIDGFVRKKVVKPLAETIIDFMIKRAEKRGHQVDVNDRNSTFGKLDEMLKMVPLLEDSDAPLVQRRELKFNEITKILDDPMDLYEINPAHCKKEVEPLIPLPEDRKFEQLSELWDRIGAKWIDAAHYSRFLGRLIDDKKFIVFLQKKFPEIKRFKYERDHNKDLVENQRICTALRLQHRNQIEARIGQLAVEKGQTANQFVAEWAKEQLKIFVAKLQGRGGVEGSQVFLDDAIQNTAKILPFLTNPAAQEIDQEDALVKLAIEGGDYCTLAMNRASREILDGFTELALAAVPNGAPVDPGKEFERQIFLELQRTRNQIIQRGFKELADALRSKEALQDTADDVHLYRMVTLLVKRGFYPLAERDENEFGLTELMLWTTFMLPARGMLFKAYQEKIPEVMNAVGINRLNNRENRILEHLRNWVGQNAALTAEEKARLLAGPLSNADENIIDPDLYPKIGRLLLVMLGVAREKKIPPAPAPAPAAAPVVNNVHVVALPNAVAAPGA